MMIKVRKYLKGAGGMKLASDFKLPFSCQFFSCYSRNVLYLKFPKRKYRKIKTISPNVSIANLLLVVLNILQVRPYFDTQ